MLNPRYLQSMVGLPGSGPDEWTLLGSLFLPLGLLAPLQPCSYLCSAVFSDPGSNRVVLHLTTFLCCPLRQKRIQSPVVCLLCSLISHRAFLVAQVVRNPPAVQETQFWSLGQEDPLAKGVATHCSILAWRIPWTEDSGWLQSMRLQRVARAWMSNTFTLISCFMYFSMWLALAYKFPVCSFLSFLVPQLSSCPPSAKVLS